MAGPKYADRVKDTTATTGTGTYTLAGSPPAGFRSFNAGIGDGNSCIYAVEDGTNWEVNIGVYTNSGLTLTRATLLASSTGSAISWAAGNKNVFVTLSAEFADKYLIPTDTFANLAAFQAGRLLLPNNGMCAYRDDGSNLVPWGPAFSFVQPIDGNYAWINQGGASKDTTHGPIILVSPDNGSAHNCRIRKKAAPSTPYHIEIAYSLDWNNQAASQLLYAGVGWRQSSDGKLVTAHYAPNGSSLYNQVTKWNSATSQSADYVSKQVFPFFAPLLFFRIGDNGTNRTVDVSDDGQTWINIHSVGRTDFMTADEVLFFSDPYTGDANMTVYGWKETA